MLHLTDTKRLHLNGELTEHDLCLKQKFERVYIRFKFYNPANENGNSLIGAKFKVNHCGTTSDGKVDIKINGDELHHGYAPPRYNFGWEEFSLPVGKLHHGVNDIKVTLNDHSFGVYWYSDATILLETGK